MPLRMISGPPENMPMAITLLRNEHLQLGRGRESVPDTASLRSLATDVLWNFVAECIDTLNKETFIHFHSHPLSTVSKIVKK